MATPGEGIGPVNYARPETNPFTMLDNVIRYNDMVKSQMISQYQQNPAYAPQFSTKMQHKILSDQRYQYGVDGGQDRTSYLRNVEATRASYGAMAATATVSTASWYAASTMGVAATKFLQAGLMSSVPKLAAFTGAMALPMAVAGALAYYPTKAIMNAADRQRFIHSTAADIEQYKDNLGFNQPLTTGAATSLGGSLQGMMSRGGYFNQEQQSRIHKIGLANNMISARGGRDGGTLRQYANNFKELKDTTEEVVKLMKTTIEGGMSIMKELKQSGFSISAIKGQIRQANAFGNMTGLGAQNMMAIGAAGAASVQGTPWSAQVGSSMYQSGAAQASFIAKSNAGGSYAVTRVGGTAAAGGILARTQMNVLSSGLGTRGVAYAMNADGSIDNNRMARLLSGKASAYEIESGASQRGYAMGISGRALFERNKENFLNNMSDTGRTQMTQRLFEKWGTQRYGNIDAKAWVFAGKYTNDIREQRLFAESLLRPKGYDRMAAENEAVRSGLSSPNFTRRQGFLGQAMYGLGAPFRAAGSGLEAFGEGTVKGFSAAVGLTSEIFGMPGKAVGYIRDRSPWSQAATIDPSIAVRNMYGLDRGISQNVANRLSLLTPQGLTKLNLPTVGQVDLKKSLGIDLPGLAKNTLSSGDLQYLNRAAMDMIHGRGGAITNDTQIRMMLKVGKLSQEKERQLALGVVQYFEKEQPVARSRYVAAEKTLSTLMSSGDNEQQLVTAGSVKKLQKALLDDTLYGGGGVIDKSKFNMSDELYNAVVGERQAKFAFNKTAGIISGSNKIDLKALEKQTADIVYSTGLGLKTYTRASGGATVAAALLPLPLELLSRYKIGGDTVLAEGRETKAAKRRYEKVSGLRSLDTAKDQAEATRTIYNKLTSARDEAEATGDSSQFQRLVSDLGWGGLDRAGIKGKISGLKRGVDALNRGEVGRAYQEFQLSGAKRVMDYLNRTTSLSGDSYGLTQRFLEGKATFKELEGDTAAMGALSTMMPAEKIREAKEGAALEIIGAKGEISLAARRDASKKAILQDLAKFRFAQKDKSGGFTVEGKKYTKEEKFIEESMVKEKLKELDADVSYSDSSRSSTNYANVQPPILNYWNNKWVL